jgi:[acyl-carrier-protein] S-malonyltransferase
MGGDLKDLPDVATSFQQAEEVLGWSVPEICQHPDDKVSRTLYTQPCLYVIESILVDLMRQKGHQPDVVAGHSLGEYVALYAAGVVDFVTGLRLVKRRAELMDAASDGMMAVLMGFDMDQLQQVLQQTADVVLANDNSAGQVVISGTPTAVDSVIGQIKTKRAMKLNVSGAFHSPLMAEAAKEFEAILESIPFAEAQVPVLSNVDPTPSRNATVLKQRLMQQMTERVRWREISLQFQEEGVTQVMEIGPGKVLTGLIKRTCPEAVLVNVSTIADMPI